MPEAVQAGLTWWGSEWLTVRLLHALLYCICTALLYRCGRAGARK